MAALGHRFSCFWVLLLVGAGGLSASLSVDTGIRWQVRDFHRVVYSFGEFTPMEWTGDYPTGQAGTVSAAFKETVRARVNYFRAMAGVPAEVQFLDEHNAAAQQAAFMMSANNTISHYPGTDWLWYTATGAEAAARSNLAWNSSGPAAVDGYIGDFGANNTAVGHRRWILFPQIDEMGTGDTPGDPVAALPPTNALWVIPETIAARPPTRESFVAWPPPGHVPATVVYARWSFSLPGADFSQATVSMTSGGSPVPVALEPVDSRLIGDPTLVWVPDNMPTDKRLHWPLPENDLTYNVSINNVLVDGTARNFTYAVTVFDPSQAGPEETPTWIPEAGPFYPTVSMEWDLPLRPWAEAVQGRMLQTAPAAVFLGAESADFPFTPMLSPGLEPIQAGRVASGSKAYLLVMPEPVDQVLELQGTYLVKPDNPILSFSSSLAWATATQTASVDINSGSGNTWSSLWQESGEVASNSAFKPVTLNLEAFAGQTVRFRFRYRFDGGSYYFSTGPSYGWAFDDIRLSGVEAVTQVQEMPVNGEASVLKLTPPSLAPFYLQARELAFGGFPLDWGPVRRIEPVNYQSAHAVPDAWNEDPVLGWLYGTASDWQLCYVMGWIHTGSLPWIYGEKGWFSYISGSARDILWLYHPDWGFLYTHESFGGWFHHQPYDAGSWKTFRN